MSRSASRVRPPLTSHNSTGGMLLGTMRGKPTEEDDEVEVEDRGQALIRKRQKERKQLRKAKERERRSETAPPSQPDESFAQSRGISRSVSRTRVPSVTRDGYFAASGTATPAGQSPRDERRAPSIYSSVADEEEIPDRASIIEEVIQDVVEDQDASEEEADASAEGDEGVTLKDRQDVSPPVAPLIPGDQH